METKTENLSKVLDEIKKDGCKVFFVPSKKGKDVLTQCDVRCMLERNLRSPSRIVVYHNFLEISESLASFLKVKERDA